MIHEDFRASEQHGPEGHKKRVTLRPSRDNSPCGRGSSKSLIYEDFMASEQHGPEGHEKRVTLLFSRDNSPCGIGSSKSLIQTLRPPVTMGL